METEERERLCSQAPLFTRGGVEAGPVGNRGGAAGPRGLAGVYRVRRRPGLLTAAAFPVCPHLSGLDSQQEVKRLGCFRWQMFPGRMAFLSGSWRRSRPDSSSSPCFCHRDCFNKNRRRVSTFPPRSHLRFAACLPSTDRREFRRFQLADLRVLLVTSGLFLVMKAASWASMARPRSAASPPFICLFLTRRN